MNLDTSSERLRAKLDLAYPVLSVHAHRIWDSPFRSRVVPRLPQDDAYDCSFSRSADGERT